MNRLIVKNIGILIAILIVFLGCNKDKNDDQPSGTLSDSTVLASSVIDLPTSLKSAQSIQTGTVNGSIKAALTRSSDSGDEGSIIGIYEGIPMYVTMASMLKDIVKGIMVDLVKDPSWRLIPLDTKIDIIPEDPNGPTQIMIEKPAGEAYEWKISAWNSSDPDNPIMIIRFTITNTGAKGQMLWNISEEDEDIAAAGIPDIIITRKVDVTFDGTSSIKTLEIKLVQDLTNVINYYTDNYSTLTLGEIAALDVGQPSKVFVNASLDDATKEYTIYGTSYHPGWAAEKVKTGDGGLFGDNRDIYMFKAKAIETDTVKGSKVYLSFPLNTTSDITNVWTDDSISGLFKVKIVDDINTMIAGQSPESGRLFTIVYIAEPSYTEKASFTQSEYDNAATYWQIADPTGIYNIFLTYTTLAAYNGYYASLPATSIDPNVLTKPGLYAITMVAKVKADITSGSRNGYTVTSAELDAFVNRNDTDPNADQFKSMYQQVTKIVNPAFFGEGGVFLGTYNETESVFYQNANNTLTASTDESSISELKALDLSTINPYVPSDVVSLDIVIQ